MTIPTVQQLCFDGLRPELFSLLNTNSPRKPSLSLHHELPQTRRQARRLSSSPLQKHMAMVCVVRGGA